LGKRPRFHAAAKAPQRHEKIIVGRSVSGRSAEDSQTRERRAEANQHEQLLVKLHQALSTSKLSKDLLKPCLIPHNITAFHGPQSIDAGILQRDLISHNYPGVQLPIRTAQKASRT
jgi:hypothetical protein